MAYEKTNWVDDETPINAENLNKMEQGIEDANNKTTGIINSTEIADKSSNAYSANVIDKMNTYSTEETFTGKYWEDGKPIYRKLFKLDATSLNTTFNFNISDIDYIVDIRGKAGFQNGEMFVLPSTYMENDAFQAKYSIGFFRLTNVGVYIYAGTYITNTAVLSGLNVILEYTKTTD